MSNLVVNAKALEPSELTLTCKGLSSVNWDSSDSEFEFVFTDKVCRVHSVLAEFLSPKVACLRKCDPLFSSYTFKDSEMFNVLERLVSSVRSGKSFRVEKSNFSALLRLSQELENNALLSSLLGMINTTTLTLEEAILVLRTGIDLGNAFSDRFGTLRNFIASHFYEIEKEILEALDLETAQLLLSSPSLRIKDGNEDSLYDFVRFRSENDLRFASLFEFVYFEYLSVNRIGDFASFVRENLLEKLNTGIWRQICRRLILDSKPKEKNPHDHWGKIEFLYDESKKFDGVIAHLTRECIGNVHDRGIVNATASSCTGYAKNAVDLGTNSSYWSNDEQDSWICYDFKERRVIPTSYSVRSYQGGPGWYHLRSWVIEVSNDGSSWTEIDRRDHNNDLNGFCVTQNFKISLVPTESFRLFRLRQTGKNHKGSYVLALTSLEVFGTLFGQ